jgi:hypothetical protein
VESVEDLKIAFAGHSELVSIEKGYLVGPQFYIHLIPEIMDQTLLREILAEVEKMNEDNRWSSGVPEIKVTLLGLKTIGRASDYNRVPQPEIIDILMKLKFTQVGIDTKFAEDYQVYLDKYGVDKKLYTTQEGEFSMYVDAVEKKVYKSSWHLDNPIDLETSPGKYKQSYLLFKELKEIE